MMEWQPIEIAPKDGTQILTWGNQKGFENWYQTSFWTKAYGGIFVGWPIKEQPTHWMPLPPPPGGNDD